MNFVEIAGHLGADPETRVTPNGIKITTLRLATNSRRAGKDETIWWRITIFGDKFDKMLPHLKKGSALIAMGELNKPEIWMDKEGRPQITLEIVAEMMRFNPFGKTDRPQQENQGHTPSYGAPSHAQNNAYSQQAPQSNYGYNQQGHSEHQSFGESHHQGSGSPQGFGHGAGNNYNDDEIPF